MKIGLIFPNKDRRYKTIHLGLAYLAAYAREIYDDLFFEVLDTRLASKKETNEFYSASYDLIGITVFSPVYFEVKNIFERIKQINHKTPVCLGGPYVTTIMGDIFKETPAEYAIYGEGEVTFSQLISCLKGIQRQEEIEGLMFRNGDGNIIINPPREKIHNLNTLPFPAYDIFPMKRYPLHRMVTSRGCPFSCAWCNSSSIWNKSYRSMDAKRIVSEIEFLISEYGKKIFVFGDNSFNADLTRVEQFCDLLIGKNLQILWSASIRADRMTQRLADKMKQAGCFNASIGVESANNYILSKIGKGTTIEKLTEGTKMLKKAGIEIMSQFVIGSPYDTLETIRESISYAKSSGCDYTNFYTVLPYKGTGQWDYVMQHGTLYTQDIHKFHTINPRIVFETPEFTYKERLQAIKLVKKEGFYSNKDTKSWLFDFAKDASQWIQRFLPKSMGDRIYLILKTVYRIKLVKKSNI